MKLGIDLFPIQEFIEESKKRYGREPTPAFIELIEHLNEFILKAYQNGYRDGRTEYEQEIICASSGGCDRI